VNIPELKNSINIENVGREMYDLIVELYPICRSITGDGLRQTLKIIQGHIPLVIHEVPTGTKAFDWTVPKEWNIRDAYVKDSRGEKIIDFQKFNLHVLNYSTPIHKMLPLNQLKEHLFTLPEHPDWIPYRTSYYKEDWGFCLSQNSLSAFSENEYEVCIDSTLEDGHLTYGEFYLKGASSDEVLISCHTCHPSLANDNLSGLALTAFLARSLFNLSLRYSYRFLFIPGTIGAITWLCLNEEKTPRIKHGLVVACVGDSGKFTYKRSRLGNEEIDRAVTHVLHCSGKEYDVVDFSPYGYDERQYCSPGFNLPVGSLTRTPHGRFPQYHTSGDNLDFVKSDCLTESLLTYLSVFRVLEGNMCYRNLNPKCEPQLGRRGLYNAIGGGQGRDSEMVMLWVLNLSDGEHFLLDIAERAGLAFDEVRISADYLITHGLLAPVEA
jgi:aminopeptidase-like protein